MNAYVIQYLVDDTTIEESMGGGTREQEEEDIMKQHIKVKNTMEKAVMGGFVEDVVEDLVEIALDILEDAVLGDAAVENVVVKDELTGSSS